MPRSVRRNRILKALLGLGLTAMLASGCGGTTDPDVDRGRTLFIENCGSCHAMAQAGTTATVGPNLDHAFAAARKVGMSEETIKGVIKPQVKHPRPSRGDAVVDMPADLVTGRDLEDVATYVSRYAGVPGAAPPTVEGPPGAQVFAEYGCGGCHVLEDAGTTGTTGPNLDEALPGSSPEQVRQAIVDPDAQVASGYPAGVMPGDYQEQMSPQEIDDLVEYLLEAAGGDSAS